MGRYGIPRLQMTPYYLEDPKEREAFLKDKAVRVTVPFSDRSTIYETDRKIGIALSRLGSQPLHRIGGLLVCNQSVGFNKMNDT